MIDTSSTDRWFSSRFTESEYVRGIPVPNTYNLSKMYSLHTRFKGHLHASGHILACSDKGTRNAEGVKNKPEEQISLSEIDENEAINIEPTDEIENKIDKKTRLKIPPEVLEYLETRLMKEYTWMEIIDGKLFCQVNFTTAGVVKCKRASFFERK